MKGQTYVILAILCIILISVFAVLNMSVVEVNYLFWSGSSPLIFIILFSVLFGGLITMLFGTWKIVQLKRQNRQLNAQLKQLQANTTRSEEHTSELQSRFDLVCRLLLDVHHRDLLSFPTRRSSDLMSVVEVNYLFWSGSSPLIFIILFSVLFGGLITMLFGTWKIVQLKRQNRQLNAQLKQLQANTTSNDQTTNKQKQLRNQEKKDE